MSSSKSKRPNILVCEDDFGSRKILTRMLAALGDVDTASNGQEAVEAAREARAAGQPYDIICLDVQMPELNGQEALRILRADELEAVGGAETSPQARILMTTASKSVREVCRAYRNEADGYLVKPIRREAILGKLAEFGFFVD